MGYYMIPYGYHLEIHFILFPLISSCHLQLSSMNLARWYQSRHMNIWSLYLFQGFCRLDTCLLISEVKVTSVVTGLFESYYVAALFEEFVSQSHTKKL